MVLYITFPPLHEKREKNVFGFCSLTIPVSCAIVLRASLVDNANWKHFANLSQSGSKLGAILQSPGKLGRGKAVLLRNLCMIQAERRLLITLFQSILALITRLACFAT